MNDRVQQIFKAEFRFGMNGVSLGSEFKIVTNAHAERTMGASWNAGVQYYDVSPCYGLGEAERGLGRFLHNQSRDSYVLSTKVGKLLKASPVNESNKFFPFSKSPSNVVFAYTAKAV